jgi:Mrp family chromosome partitioning ATPase
MDPVEYLRTIKRRWRIVATIVVLALVGAWLSTSLGILTGGKRKYPATVSMVQRYNRAGGDSNVRSTAAAPAGTTSTLLIASLVTTDNIVERVVKKISYPGKPDVLANSVTATIEKSSGLLKITAEATNPERAKLIANAFSTEIIAYLVERDQELLTAQIKGLDEQIFRIKAEIVALDKQIKKYPVSALPVLPGVGGSRTGSSGSTSTGPLTSPADPFVAQRQAALQTLTSLSSQLQTAKAQTPDGEGLEILQAAALDDGSAVIALPRSLFARLILALILGTLAGISVALIRERFDPRIRTKEAAERHFGVPVLAEIPGVRRRGSHDVSLSPSTLAPEVADAFRLLFAGLNGGRRRSNGAPGDRQLRPRAILVTSAGSGEGKAAVLANLSGTLAEVGKTVTIVSCDFRHPDLLGAFGLSADKGGLAETLQAHNGGPLLNSCIRPTSAPGVWVVPSGTATDWTSDQILASADLRRLLMEARQRSDLLLVDTSPILTSDPTFLLPEVDGVLVVVQAGTIKPDLAERSGELLKRMGAPVLGLVLIGNNTAGLPRGYYGTSSPLQVVIGIPKAALRGAGRAAASLLRLQRRRKQGSETPVIASAMASTSAMHKPPVEIDLTRMDGNGEANGNRGFPRLMRRSGNR